MARLHLWLSLTTTCLMLAAASSVRAQAWLSDRKRTEGHGIRVGDLELHPGVGVEGGYYTNPFYADKNVEGAGALRISPHLFLSTLGAERSGADNGTAAPGWVRFIGGFAGTLHHYFTDPARTPVGTDVKMELTLAPERPVGLRLSETLNISGLPFSDTTLPAATNSANSRRPNFTRYRNNAAAQVLLQTSGGLLKGSLGYQFGFMLFEDNRFQLNNMLLHTAMLDASWEFLPKTALFYEARYSFQDYPNGGSASGRPLDPLESVNLVSTRLGINGAITSRWGATLALGYGAGFFRGGGDDPERLIGQAELRFTPSDMSQVALAADRSMVPAYQGNFQESNRIFAHLRWLIARVVLVGLRGGIEFLSFGHDSTQAALAMRESAGDRKDRRYFGEVSGEYRFVDWLAVTAQANMLIDDTKFAFQPVDPNVAVDPAKFTAFEFWLGLRAFY